jgi:hypothetical protein
MITAHCLAEATPTATTVLASTIPAIFGAPVTLTATVSPSDATGKVTFYDGVMLLGIAPVAKGVASYSTTMLPVGNRKLRATYGGDSIYEASASDTFPMTVLAAAGNILAAVPVPLESNQFHQEGSVVADFNQDGKADLALVSSSFGVTVLLGNGDGSFQQLLRYPTLRFNSLAVADFDGDGIPDLIVGGVQSVTILLGNGDGTFKSPVNYALLAPGEPGFGSFDFGVGDFNGDGQVDVVVVSNTGFNGEAGKIRVLPGNGDGTLQQVVNSPFSMPTSPYLAAVGDFNGDGKPDLLIGGFTDSPVLCARLGNGDGTFQEGPCFAAGFATAIAVYDINDDGKDDLVVGSQTPNAVSVLLTNGDGTFTVAGTYTVEFPDSVATGDFNGDGNIDIVFVSEHGGADGVGSITLLYGNGDGTFQAPVNYSPAGEPTYPGLVAVADFNGDGTADLATFSNLGAPVQVWLGVLATISTTGGTPQSAFPNQQFGAALQATVQDAAGKPVKGATVTFTPPAAGASVTFYPNARVGLPVRLLTDDSGIAAALATANNTPGNYVVTATVGLLSTSFTLTNGTIP